MKRLTKTILISILIGVIIGFFNTFFVYEGFWQHFNKGLNSVFGWVHMLYVILALFFVILAHEMGHFISFKKHGIKPKALYVLGIAFVNDNGWKIRFVPKFLLFIGGIVIPQHISISNEKAEAQMVDNFKKVLLAGPKASIIYGVTIFILWLLFLMSNFYVVNGLMFTTMIVTSIMTVLAILSSRVSKLGMYGDFAAKNAFDQDPLFRLTYLIQLTTLIEHDKESMDYFWPKIVHTLETKNQINNQLYMSLLGQYLHEIIFEGRIACTSIDKKIQKYLLKAPKTEDALTIYLNAIYYYEALGQSDKVLSLLNKLDTTKIKIDYKVLMYYLRLTNHLLKLKDEIEFLDNPKHIHSSSMAWVYKPLNLKNELKEIIK